MKCQNCNRHVRDENAIGRYGPTCAKRLGIVAAKPAREKKTRKPRFPTGPYGPRKPDPRQDDLFKGVV